MGCWHARTGVRVGRILHLLPRERGGPLLKVRLQGHGQLALELPAQAPTDASRAQGQAPESTAVSLEAPGHAHPSTPHALWQSLQRHP